MNCLKDFFMTLKMVIQKQPITDEKFSKKKFNKVMWATETKTDPNMELFLEWGQLSI